jgi:hypothetical protein
VNAGKEVNETDKGNEKISCVNRAQGRAKDDAQKAGASEAHIKVAQAGREAWKMTVMDMQFMIIIAPTVALVVWMIKCG